MSKVSIGTSVLTRDLVWCECGRGLSLNGTWEYCPKCGSLIDQESYLSAVELATKNGAYRYRDTYQVDLEIANTKLKAFAVGVMEGWPEECGQGGVDLQNLAVTYGLLVEREMAEPCGENCNCASNGAGFPTRCFRKTELLKEGAI